MSEVQSRPLGHVVRPTRPRVKPQDRPDLPFIGMEHVEAHSMRLLGTVPAESMKSSAVHFQPGDVLYGRLRPYLNKVYRPNFEGLCSAEFIVLPETDELDGSYLQYFLNSGEFVRFASHLNAGDRPRVDFEQISEYPIPLPPKAKQTEIVAEFEKQFSRLDEAIANLKRVKANLKRYKVAILNEALIGRLVPTEESLALSKGLEYESGAELLQRVLAMRRAQWVGRGLYKESPGVDTAGLPALPKGWAWARLDAVANLKGGITVDSKRQDPGARSVPYLRVANVQRGFLDLSEVKYINAPARDIEELRLQPGDILFNEGGDRDKLGRGWIWEGQLPDCIHQNHVFRARLLSSEISPRFVSWWGNTFGKDYFQREGKQTTNLASITLTKLSAFPVPIPPKAEQQRIVAEVERVLSIHDEATGEVERNFARASALKQAVLSKVFSVTT